MMNDRLPDSNEYLSRLESRLKKINGNNSNKLNGKTMIKSMSEFREVFMINAFQNNLDLNQNNRSETYTNVNYVQRLISPVQIINTEESKYLIDNDWLDKRFVNESTETFEVHLE